MAANSLSRLKKAAEAKKKGGAAKAAVRENAVPAAKGNAKEYVPPVPAPQKELPRQTPAKPKAPPATAPPLQPRAQISPKPDLSRRIMDAVMEDPRLTDYSQVAKVLMAVRRRKGEIEGKIKSIKDVVDEEVKKLLEGK
jgi:hypothetical protein